MDAAGIAAGVERDAVDVARVKKTALNHAGAAGSAKKMPRADRGHVLRASWLQWKSKRASGESSDRKSYLFHFALPPFGAVELDNDADKRFLHQLADILWMNAETAADGSDFRPDRGPRRRARVGFCEFGGATDVALADVFPVVWTQSSRGLGAKRATMNRLARMPDRAVVAVRRSAGGVAEQSW